MSEKMDIFEFNKRIQSQYGFSDEDVSRFSKSQILTFWKDDLGQVISRLPSKGTVVFRDKEKGIQIKEGETWLCDIAQKGTYSFATGILRFDAKAFFDLRSDQVDTLAELIWEKNRAMLEPRFESLYLETLNRKVEERVADVRKKADDESQRAEELRKQIEAMQLKNGMDIKALENQLQEAKEALRQPSPQNLDNQNSIDNILTSQSMHPKVRRISPDRVHSIEFRDRRYFVHISVDRNIMTIRPHSSGNVTCIEGCLSLRGLGLLAPYNGPTDLSAEYNPRYGGYLVMLRELQ